MEYRLFTGGERPDMLELQSETVWPEFIFHDIVGERYWDELFVQFPVFQFALTEGDRVVGTGNSIPLCLDGPPDDGGWDWALEKGFEDLQAGRTPNVLCGLQIGIDNHDRGKGVSRLMIDAMRRIAAEQGFSQLILPIRPTLKHKYPLIPMQEYIRWKTPEGLPYDPWIRAHVRQGAEIVSVCSRAMYIPGTIEEWTLWTGLSIQSSGDYIIEGGLSPLKADLESNRAEYVEPNVWVIHRI